MKRPAVFPLSILLLGLFVFSPGCGTDVGNAGKPIVNDQSELAVVVGMGHDEVVSSSNDGSDSDATPAFALQSGAERSNLAEVETTCTQNKDGSVDVTTTRTLAFETEFGRTAKRKVQKDSLDTSVNMQFSVPAALGSLSCKNNRPSLSWAQLAELKTVAKLDKNRKRSVTLKADGSAINQSELTVSSERSVQFARVAASLESLTVRRTSTMSSTVSLLRNQSEDPITRTVATLPNEPIVLEKTRTRGAGITHVEIVSGAVASTHKDEKKVVLRYKNLVLNIGSSCHPSSGSIEGQIFTSSNDAEAESTFTVVFDSDGAILVTADGSEEDIELESCQI